MYVDRYAGSNPLVDDLIAKSKSFLIDDFNIGPMNKQDIPRHGGDPAQLENYLRRKYLPGSGGQGEGTDLPGFVKGV